MQIADLVLYGDNNKVRHISFGLGQLNIIIGRNRTGKSALIQIIEYCLGRTRSDVPRGVITQTVRWYGLRLQFPNQQVFIARRAPATGESSSVDVCLIIGTDVAIPSSSELKPNAKFNDLRRLLSSLLGMVENLHVPSSNESSLPLETTIRHGLLLSFQNATEIDSPTLLFHRQGEDYMEQTYRATLPYLLGAVADNRLAKQNELRQARREQTLIERQIQEAESASAESLPRGQGLIAEAIQSGLIPSGSSERTIEGIRSLLSRALELSPDNEVAIAEDEISVLQRNRESLLDRLRGLQFRLRTAQNCAVGQKGFTAEAREQHARLKFVDIYRGNDQPEGVVNCPLCESQIVSPTPSVTFLKSALNRVTRQLEEVRGEEPRLLDLITRIQNDIAETRSQIIENRAALQTLTVPQTNPAQHLQAFINRARVQGKIEMYLDGLRNIPTVRVDRSALEVAKQRVQEIEQDLIANSEEAKLPSLVNLVNQVLTQYARELGLEYSNYAVRFDLNKLNIVADTPQGPVSLAQIGSGANWVGYHIALHFALHSWFILAKRPVPRFLILDQPSIAYYPTERSEESLALVLGDEREDVRMLFEWMDRTTRSLNSELQVIVLDHVDIQEEWFQKCVVQRWEGQVKLIPSDWYEVDGR